MLANNVKFLSTNRFCEGGFSVGNYANFNLATYTKDDIGAVEKNRELLIKKFNIPGKLKFLEQIHSNICLDINSKKCVGDALITSSKNQVCAILTADCLPIFASNKSGTKAGVAHAGWQGILNGVIEEFIYNFQDKEVLVHFGAAISQNALELGVEVFQQFIDKDKSLIEAFIKKNDKYYLDIYQAAKIILNKLGVKNITGGGCCTFSQKDKYFSYRRDGANSGRMAHLIWIT